MAVVGAAERVAAAVVAAIRATAIFLRTKGSASLLLRGILRAVWSLSRRRWHRVSGEWNPRDTAPALVRGGERCVACFLCAAACPTQCIELAAGPDPEGLRERVPLRFSIDIGRCFRCGLCAQVCPQAALEMADVSRTVYTSRSAQKGELVSQAN